MFAEALADISDALPLIARVICILLSIVGLIGLVIWLLEKEP